MRRALLTPTDAPAQWAVVWSLGLGALGGLVVASIAGWAGSSVLPIVAAGAVAASAAGGPPGAAPRLVSMGAAVVLCGVSIAGVTAGDPAWAAGAMAAVAVLTSALAAAGPVGAGLGTLGTMAYAVTAAIVLLQGLDESLTNTGIAWRAAVGCAVGALTGLVLARARASRSASAVPPAPWSAMLASLRRFDTHAHDGIRRAVVLGPAMYVLQDDGSREALWVFLGALGVLHTPAKLAVPTAVSRVGGTVLGVSLLGLLGLLLPVELLVLLAGLAMLPGIAYVRRYPLLSGGLLALSAIVAAGAPSGQIDEWASRRVVDTVLGCAIALAAQALLWPRDRAPMEDEVDGDPDAAL